MAGTYVNSWIFQPAMLVYKGNHHVLKSNRSFIHGPHPFFLPCLFRSVTYCWCFRYHTLSSWECWEGSDLELRGYLRNPSWLTPPKVSISTPTTCFARWSFWDFWIIKSQKLEDLSLLWRNHFSGTFAFGGSLSNSCETPMRPMRVISIIPNLAHVHIVMIV